MQSPYTALEFFAGSGLVSAALYPYIQTVWANDIDSSKARIFAANHPATKFHLGDIRDVRGENLPTADLAWGSFPCQDLSLAGDMKGIHADRSGLVWEWLRIIGELARKPSIVVAENVLGLVTAHGGRNYLELHDALSELGYHVGAVVIDAAKWLPQSRVRVFVIGVQAQLDSSTCQANRAIWCHPAAIQRISTLLPDFKFWNIPEPTSLRGDLNSVIDRSAEWDSPTSEAMLRLIPDTLKTQIERRLVIEPNNVFAGYRRTRNGSQRLEVRTDGLAGCLRTARGGSSKQIVVYQVKGQLVARFMTPFEAAKLMGAPKGYQLRGTVNEAYTAMGDAVAVPVTTHLAQTILSNILQATPKHELVPS